jgi:hypothetical protein
MKLFAWEPNATLLAICISHRHNRHQQPISSRSSSPESNDVRGLQVSLLDGGMARRSTGTIAFWVSIPEGWSDSIRSQLTRVSDGPLVCGFAPADASGVEAAPLLHGSADADPRFPSLAHASLFGFGGDPCHPCGSCAQMEM